jgi:hypothetical protein
VWVVVRYTRDGWVRAVAALPDVGWSPAVLSTCRVGLGQGQEDSVGGVADFAVTASRAASALLTPAEAAWSRIEAIKSRTAYCRGESPKNLPCRSRL